MICKWCGKQFNYDSSQRGSRSNVYCCGRCYNAAMRAEQKKRKESEQFQKDHPLAIFFIIGIILVIAIIPSKKQDNNRQTTIKTEQEKIVKQSRSKENSFDQSVKQSDKIIEKEAEYFTFDKTNTTESNDNYIDYEALCKEIETQEYYEALGKEIEEQVIADYKSREIWDRETLDLKSAFLAAYAAEEESGYLFLDGDVYYHTQDEIDINSLEITVKVNLLDENHAHVFVKLNHDEQPSLLVMVRDMENELWLVDDIRDAQNTYSLKEGLYEFASQNRDDSGVDKKEIKEKKKQDKKEMKEKKKKERKDKRDKRKQERSERKHGKKG